MKTEEKEEQLQQSRASINVAAQGKCSSGGLLNIGRAMSLVPLGNNPIQIQPLQLLVLPHSRLAPSLLP